ncbi:hypothetical protein MiAbB_03057 [Microcystis aeruginosa NIES-4285]|uniref:PIN domain-containing protein n=4 Tax=Microcystis aeruginosa TaxID=1126 RepID=A0A402DG01_MICAE|nr:hypothetical protein MiAbB_03057 [Microcystis aeruginosa NIES-4285]
MLPSLLEICCMNAVDTNVLIYVNDSRYPSKQAIAASLVANLTEGVLIWQVACEYLAASRKLEPFGYCKVLPILCTPNELMGD